MTNNYGKLVNRIYKSNFFIVAIYLIMPFIFHGLGVDLTKFALAPGDGFIYGFPTKLYSTTLNLWNPFVQCGTSVIKDIGKQSMYLPGIAIMSLSPNAFGYNLFMLLHYTAAGYFTYLFLTSVKLNRTSSFIGGVAFMFCGFLVAHKGHHSMMNAGVWLPLLLFFIEKFIKNKKVIYLFLASFAFSFCIFADYLAITVYTGMVALPYLIFRIWFNHEYNNENIFKKVKLSIVYSFIIFAGGLLLSAVQVIPIIEALQHVTRERISFEFFSSYSFPIIALPLMLFPFFYGTHTPGFYGVMYYGPWNLSEMAGYIGIIPPMLSMLAFALWRKIDKQIWFWSLIAVLGFLLVLGDSTPLYRIMYHVPFYNMFRASARNWFEVNFSIAVLTAFSINYITLDNSDTIKYYKKHISIVVVGLLAVTSIILGYIFMTHKLFSFLAIDNLNTTVNLYGVQVKAAQLIERFIKNTQINSPSIYIPLILIPCSICLLIFLPKYKRRRIFWVLLSCFIFMDLFSFGHFHDNAYSDASFVNSEKKYANDVFDFLQSNNQGSDLSEYRILPLDMGSGISLYPEINILYGVSSVNDYGPIWLKNYKSLTSIEADGVPSKAASLIKNPSILSLLSTKYIITSNEELKQFIESILLTSETGQSVTILDGFQQNGWEFFSPFERKDESIVLKSSEGNDVSLIQYACELKKTTDYKVTFEVRCDEPPNQPLVVDFFANGYDSPEQELQYNPLGVDAKYKTIRCILNTGYGSPEKANIRFFTFSTIPIEIKNIKVEAIDKKSSCWRQNNGEDLVEKLYCRKKDTADGITIYENMNFLPRARFVKDALQVKSFEESGDILWYDSEFNPSVSALVEGIKNNVILDYGQVLNTDYSNNDSVRLTVKTGNNSFLVLSDTWYPGWKAYVDGKETRIYKTNGVTRGIFINGEGEHEVEFIFKPDSFYIGLTISLVVVLLMVIYLIYNNIKCKKQSLKT